MSKQQLLGSLLKTLCDAHWAAAVGCKPEPALMLPLSVDTALVAATEGLLPEPQQLRRAVAAAERRAVVSPPGGCAAGLTPGRAYGSGRGAYVI